MLVVMNQEPTMTQPDKFTKEQARAAYMKLMARQYQKTMENYAPLVSSLVQNFEQRKCAWTEKHTRHTTGNRINTARIAQYKTSEDIFKRISMAQCGERHGAILIVDWSSSMDHVLRHVVCQAISISKFMRTCKIPFRVILFTDHQNNFGVKREMMNVVKNADVNSIKNKNHNASPENPEVLLDSNVQLYMNNLEILSSQMTDAEFEFASQMFYNMTVNRILPTYSTPLNESLINVMNAVIPKFRQAENLKQETLFVLTDGDGTDEMYGYSAIRFGSNSSSLDVKSVNNKYPSTVDGNRSNCSTMTTSLFLKLRMNGTRVVHIFLTSGYAQNNVFDQNGIYSVTGMHAKGANLLLKVNAEKLHSASYDHTKMAHDTTNYSYDTGSIPKSFSTWKNAEAEISVPGNDAYWINRGHVNYKQRDRMQKITQQISDGRLTRLSEVVQNEGANKKGMMSIASILVAQLTSQMFPTD